MNYIYFKIPTLYPEAETAKLNHVLSTQAIASVKEQFVDDGQNSFWSVRVAIVENATKTAIEASKSSKRSGGVDYREVLSPEIFTIYAKLRTLRNAIAEQQSIPAYAIFTNEQLAEMAKLEQPNKANIATIDGIGEKRLALYVDQFIELLLKQDG